MTSHSIAKISERILCGKMAVNLEMEEMREEIERLRTENARLKETPEPSSQDLMEYPLKIEPEVEPEVKTR